MTDNEKKIQEMEHRKEMLHKTEKGALQSKKFLAWLIQQVLMAAMALTALLNQTDAGLGWDLAAFMGGIVFMMGISTMWYLGKQAAADVAVRGYAMVGRVAGLAGSAIGISGKPLKPKEDGGSEPAPSED